MIVDANVVVYWSVPGPHAMAASAVLARTDLRAPSLILVEASSALLKYVRAGLYRQDQMRDAVDGLPDAFSELVSDMALLPRAVDLALTSNHKIYDCLYIALALQRREPLATADGRMAEIARGLSVDVHQIKAS